MGESLDNMIDDYRDRRVNKQIRHRANKAYNTKKLKESGIEYREANPECFLFREGLRRADFYPSSGRWKVLDTNEIMSGGINKFLAWLDGRETW